MKMVLVSYNEAIDNDIMDALENCNIKNYTKINSVFGRGIASGTHLGDDIWPGRNNILYVACQDSEAKQIISCVKELRKKLGQEGIKAFSWNLDEIT